MNRIVGIVLVALAMLPLPLAGQQDAAARIQAATRRVAAAGIPTSLVESRVAEGRAKGVPLDRIAAVVERRAASLVQARDAMSPAVSALTTADLAAGADAVEAGIGGVALRAVISQAQGEDRSVAIAVLTYLHREQGIPVNEALGQVRQALKKGPEALRALPAQAAAARGRRGPPEGRGPDRGGGRGGGPPEALPTPGKKPGAGKPDDRGRPDNPGKPDKPGKPGRPGGGPGGGG